jgi:hypothetical protein
VSAGQSDFNILLLVLPLGSWLFLFSFLLGGYVFPFFSFIIFPTETGAKNKRPQARPRAKESVMIPTLLMNIPTSPNNQTQYLFASGFGFCESFFFVLLLRHGRQGGIYRDRREEERSALEVEMANTTEGERNQVVTPLALVGSLSRVRPSFRK